MIELILDYDSIRDGFSKVGCRLMAGRYFGKLMIKIMLGDSSVKKTKQIFAHLFLMLLGLGEANAEYALNMPKGVTRISNDVYDLHMLILWICVAIGVLVFGVMFYSIYYHRKSVGHQAEQFHDNAKIELLWTVIPTIILVVMAIPATKTMMQMDDVSEPDITIKITGWQWKWEYDYLDSGVHFFSSLDAESNQARQLGSGVEAADVDNYLLNVDNPLVLPVNKKIRFLLTASDVIHSWWVPEFGWKKDNIPGFINDAWVSVEKPGIYRGQCAELCGKDHGYMPIVVIAKEQAEYEQWLEEKKAQALAAASSADREWSQAELIAKGAEVYQANCASCHMADGQGVPGTFPALAGSSVVTGPLDGEVSIVLNGRGMMPSFGAMLNASDLAAGISFTRNGLSNKVGDSVQPLIIKPLLAAMTQPEEDDDW